MRASWAPGWAGCGGSAATARRAVGEMLRWAWVGRRQPPDWRRRWERRWRMGRVLGRGRTQGKSMMLGRGRRDGGLGTAVETCQGAVRADSERRLGPGTGGERWGARAGDHGLRVGGSGGWQCRPARRRRPLDEVLDDDGSAQGDSAAAAPPRGIEPRPLVAVVPPGGPSQRVVKGRRRAERACSRTMRSAPGAEKC